jgi:hypothetical protein
LTPSIGRIVHYVVSSGVHRPAIIIDMVGGSAPSINLQVFSDPTDDDIIPFQRAVLYDETNKPRTWHWPERVE